MPWSDKPVDPKYRTVEHRKLRDYYVQMIRSGEFPKCTAKVCVFLGAPITNTDGRVGDGLHLGHADNGVDYAGPQHRACNIKDGAVRGNRRRQEDHPVPPAHWAKDPDPYRPCPHLGCNLRAHYHCQECPPGCAACDG